MSIDGSLCFFRSKPAPTHLFWEDQIQDNQICNLRVVMAGLGKLLELKCVEKQLGDINIA